jgi:hypothetical protein
MFSSADLQLAAKTLSLIFSSTKKQKIVISACTENTYSIYNNNNNNNNNTIPVYKAICVHEGKYNIGSTKVKMENEWSTKAREGL